ncbi:MAG TPA: YgiQ family radical SAM protein [Desulfurivibrionaceae bacterium]|nr:YgiQ family radical SAM protein [Desulfurivibrionaceae bacterium]
MPADFLPTTAEEMRSRGWEQPDVILVTGDAYLDHPAFGVSLIGRWLEAHGYKVAILAQPRHDDHRDFLRFGAPRLFFGITGGNLDSIVANYTGNAKVRDEDNYSPGGNPYFGEIREKGQRRRPDRAVIRYAALARQAFPETVLILGGLEASLRRFIHFDYQQNRLRGSVLTDAKADLLVYGMGERAVLEVAQRLERGEGLSNIPGTCERLTENAYRERELVTPSLHLPNWWEIEQDPALFLQAELAIDRQARALAEQPLSQAQQALWVWQNRPAAPLTTGELDRLYELPFRREPPPGSMRVPAWEMIRHSLTIVRGCSGNCSFCAITRHQGVVTVDRSPESVVREVSELTRHPHFRGTVSDLGGPTANLYGTGCRLKNCRKRDCFSPELCKNLGIDEEKFLNLLRSCQAVPGVKNLHVSSGLRIELLLKTPRLLAELLTSHLPGAMKIAPEHTDPEVLRLMHKPGSRLLPEFLAQCRKLAAAGNTKLSFIPYFIASHPGCNEAAMLDLAATARREGLEVRKFQDFTPTPGTISTAMYYTGLDRDTGRPIFVARSHSQRQAQRQVLEGITLRQKGGSSRVPQKKRPVPKAGR